MLQKSRDTVERYLRNRGFTSPDSRRIVADQVLLTAAACIAGVLVLPLTAWGLAFGLGTLLATINLWQIARFAHWSVTRRFTGRLAVIGFCAFLFRFAGTGFVLYLLLIPARMPVIPLVAGLSSLVVWLSVMRFSRPAGHSCKEA
ncbi:putative ATP synthase I chain [uncultured delta proteobacterium]|uniref:Putative ATP synthase I chain n=1 Tax=uncultured delta proteobacterium TaxID=34034 RepID=A0A212JDM6_9DELT|nr:putative ATP synthase I chain [uncultured delta proteobacterium]